MSMIGHEVNIIRCGEARKGLTFELVVEVCSRRDAGVCDRVEPYHEVRGEGLEGSRERRNRKRYRWRTRTQGCVEWY